MLFRSTGSGSVYKMQEISGSAASIVSSTLSSLSASIPAYGVQLVTISSGPSAVISAIAGAGGSVPAVASISPNGYFTIYGSGFAPAGTSRSLQPSDIKNNALPTSLANTCVNVGSTRAFLSFVSPGQINALAPAMTGTSTSVSVVTNCGTATESTTSALSVPVASASPEFLYFVQNADGRRSEEHTSEL